MTIELINIGKRFKKNWIFRGVNLFFTLGSSYAITGANGSGKSTLLKIIAGFDNYNFGNILCIVNEKKIEKNDFCYLVSFCAPYQELIREMTLVEFILFHQKMTHTFDYTHMIETVGLKGNENKLLNDFSSGMLQRLKLGITFYSNKLVLLFDEPCTNLDDSGKEIFKSLFNKYKTQKLIILASNEHDEISLCNKIIDIALYKSVVS